MWVITEDGFYSAVQHTEDPNLLVIRTRVKADLDLLHEVLGDLGHPSEIQTPMDTDYPWRTITTKDGWTQYLALAVQEIDYGNFKDRVKQAQGPARAGRYGEVWAVLYALEYEDPDRRLHSARFSPVQVPEQGHAFPWDR